MKWGQRLQSELEFVLAPDQTVPLSVAPVSLYKGLRKKRTEGGEGKKKAHTRSSWHGSPHPTTVESLTDDGS